MQTKDNQANARRAEQATDNWMDKSTYEFAAISVLAPLESFRRLLPFYEVEENQFAVDKQIETQKHAFPTWLCFGPCRI